jgi:uncharacterized membrane protein YgaE (UPF0421/DUF939 family)
MTSDRIHDVQLAIRAALAATIAYWAATYFESQYAIYALIAAVVVTNLSPQETRKMAGPRLVGTVVGAVGGAVATLVLPVGPLALGAAILVAMLTMYLLGMQAAAKISGYTAAIVMFTHAGDPWLFAAMRAFENVLGIGAAVLVSYLPKLMREPAPPAPPSTP